MKNRNTFPRFLLVLSLLIGFCAGTFAPRLDVVEAKPLAANALDVIINEVAWGGLQRLRLMNGLNFITPLDKTLICLAGYCRQQTVLQPYHYPESFPQTAIFYWKEQTITQSLI